MIIEFQPNSMLLSYTPQWWLYYKEENELEFHKISVSFEQLKLFLEKYGYETNDLTRLEHFGVDVKNITNNPKLQAFH